MSESRKPWVSARQSEWDIVEELDRKWRMDHDREFRYKLLRQATDHGNRIAMAFAARISNNPELAEDIIFG